MTVTPAQALANLQATLGQLIADAAKVQAAMSEMAAALTPAPVTQPIATTASGTSFGSAVDIPTLNNG